MFENGRKGHTLQSEKLGNRKDRNDRKSRFVTYGKLDNAIWGSPADPIGLVYKSTSANCPTHFREEAKNNLDSEFRNLFIVFQIRQVAVECESHSVMDHFL